jgi:hypothetical protein
MALDRAEAARAHRDETRERSATEGDSREGARGRDEEVTKECHSVIYHMQSINKPGAREPYLTL